MTEAGRDQRGTRALVLFAREPRPGRVKTRLATVLGEANTLALYRRLLTRQVSLANAFACDDRQLWVDGDPGHQDFRRFQGSVHRQQGGDIGERMDRALGHALAATDAAVLIGCDCPALDTGCLEDAFTALEDGSDAVFVPALDGGYVLVGLRRPAPALFAGIPWGTGTVMGRTRERLQSLALDWRELPALPDIDEPDDLARLPGDWDHRPA